MNPKQEPLTAVEFVEIPLTKAQLASLGNEERGTFIAAALAANQITLLWRLNMMAGNTSEEERGIAKAASMVLQLMLHRSLSAAVYEFHQALTKYLQRTAKSKSPTWQALDDIRRNIEKPKAFQFATFLRNKATYHFDYQSLGSFLAHFDDDAHPFEIYEHEAAGNSFYPMAEEIVLQAALKQEWLGGVQIQDWLDWVRNASMMAVDAQKIIANEVIEATGATGRLRRAAIPTRMVFDESVRLPIIYRETGKRPARPKPDGA